MRIVLNDRKYIVQLKYVLIVNAVFRSFLAISDIDRLNVHETNKIKQNCNKNLN